MSTAATEARLNMLEHMADTSSSDFEKGQTIYIDIN